MELEVQRFLRKHSQEHPNHFHNLLALEEEYGIENTLHESLPLVILNYSQIDSPKNEQICKECRGLVLETGTWDIVAKSFNRFFNYGENLEDTERFDWNNSIYVNEKVDGSLMLCWYYRGAWRVSTRGSFAQGECGHSGLSWEQIFLQCLDKCMLHTLPTWYTYVFELVGPHNKIVRDYKQNDVYLLTIMNNLQLQELTPKEVDGLARYFNCKRPTVYTFSLADDIIKHLAELKDATFEGVVARDINGLRLKIKSPTYLALHRMRGNNGDGLYNPKNIIPVLLANEQEEVYTYYPEVKSKWEEWKLRLDEEFATLCKVWLEAQGIVSQKDFAQYILPRTQFASLLFTARKTEKGLGELWRQSAELIIKRLT